MRLVTIEADGLIGRRTTIQVDRALYFRGHNGAGKSIGLSLLDIALIGPSAGKWPKIGKPIAAFGVTLTVEGKDGEEHTIMRGFTGKGNTCLIDREAPDDAALKITEILGGKAGRESPTRTGRFDLGAFLSLTGPQKAQWLATHVFAGSWTDDELRAELAQRGLDVTQATAEVTEDSQADMPSRTALKAVSAARSPIELHAALVSLIGFRLSDLNRRVEVLEGAAITDETEAMAELDLPPGSVAHYESEAETLRGQIAALDARLEAATGQVRRREELERQIGNAAAEATTAEAEAAPLADRAATEAARAEGELTQAVATAQERVTQLEAELTASAAKGEGLRTTSDRLNEARNMASGAANMARRVTNDAKAKVENLELARGRDGMPERLRKALADTLDLVEHLYDLHGEAHGEWTEEEQATQDRARKALAMVAAPPSDEELAAAKVAERSALAASAMADEAHTGAQTQAASAERLLTTQRGAHAKIQTDLTAARTALSQAGTARDTARSTAQRLLDDQVGKTATATRKREHAQSLRSELDAITVTDTSAEADQRTGLAERLRQADAAATKLRDSETLKRSAERRVAQLDDERARAGRWAAWRKAAAEARDALVAKERNPIADLANVTLGTLIGREIVIDKGDVKIKVIAHTGLAPLAQVGSVYDLDSASLAETAIVGAILTAALQSHLGGWRVVIVDELAVIEPPLRTAFVSALVGMLDNGVLDNVLLAGWDACDVPGVRTIDL